MNSCFGMSRHMPGFNKEAILKVHARLRAQHSLTGTHTETFQEFGVITKSFEETRAYKNKAETLRSIYRCTVIKGFKKKEDLLKDKSKLRLHINYINILKLRYQSNSCEFKYVKHEI